jgi:hypothetical protein
MPRTLTIALFTATMVVAACNKPAGEPVATPGPPAGPVAATPARSAVAAGKNTELETRGLALMHQMAELFAADAKDCDKLAVDVQAFIAQHRPLLVELTTLEKAQSPAERKAFEVRNQAAKDAVADKMGPAMAACREHPSLVAAMRDFPGD